jgi:preprotein translocase subunit SecG
MLTLLLVAIHIVVSVILILVVLLQTGKRADLAGAFGGGGSQTAFGARGAATFLSKATTWSAIIFMVTSIWLGVRFGSESGSSVVTDTGSPTPASSPAAPQAKPIQLPPAGGIPVQPAPAPAPAPVPANPPTNDGKTPAQTPPAAPGHK